MCASLYQDQGKTQERNPSFLLHAVSSRALRRGPSVEIRRREAGASISPSQGLRCAASKGNPNPDNRVGKIHVIIPVLSPASRQSVSQPVNKAVSQPFSHPDSFQPVSHPVSCQTVSHPFSRPVSQPSRQPGGRPAIQLVS